MQTIGLNSRLSQGDKIHRKNYRSQMYGFWQRPAAWSALQKAECFTFKEANHPLCLQRHPELPAEVGRGGCPGRCVLQPGHPPPAPHRAVRRQGWLDFSCSSPEMPLESTTGPLKGGGIPLPYAAPSVLLKEHSRKAPTCPGSTGSMSLPRGSRVPTNGGPFRETKWPEADAKNKQNPH